MTVLVRPAQAADADACMTLLRALTSATGSTMDTAALAVFELLLGGTRGEVLVAEEDGRLLGLASVSYNLAMRYGGEYCQLEELIVDPEARGKHLGALLVDATLERARQRGCGEYGLYLVAATEHNRGFYEKRGFTVVGSELRQKL